MGTPVRNRTGVDTVTAFPGTTVDIAGAGASYLTGDVGVIPLMAGVDPIPSGWAYGAWWNYLPGDYGSIEIDFRLSPAYIADHSAVAFCIYSGPVLEAADPDGLTLLGGPTVYDTFTVVDNVNYYIQGLAHDLSAVLSAVMTGPPPDDQSPVIVLHPWDTTVDDGHSVTFRSRAAGQPAPTCQWQRRTH